MNRHVASGPRWKLVPSDAVGSAWWRHSRRKGIRSVSGRSIDSSMIWATVSNPTARRSRAATIRTGMRNFSTLIGGLRPSSNGGQEWHPHGQPEKVNGHDFPDKVLGKIIPYGVYDEATNTGWVSVGVDHDTAECAVETVRRWWRHMGSKVYPKAKRILITADGGGSNGSRCRLWKVELQRFANESGLGISVCHFPPGTSKWNKIEHRMFCHITENWRGRPLVSREVVVNLIGHTTTKTGLTIRSELDENIYPTGREVTAQQLESLAIKRDKFHGEWNYTIRPKT